MPVTLEFTVPVPSPGEELRLARAIEAGVLAAELRGAPAPPRPAGRARRRPAPPPATADELDSLIHEGECAWRRMVAGNLRLVVMVTRPFGRGDLDADELFQEGTLGLMEALRRFDHRRGARFATFALPWIRTRVADAAATRCGSLPIPAGRARARIRARGVESSLSARLGRAATVAEVAESVGRPESWVQAALEYRPPVSLEQLIDIGHAEPIAEPLADELCLHRVLRRLSAEERAVVERLYGFGQREMSYQEAADDLGVSTSTVRRREHSALDRLRRCGDLDDWGRTMAG